MKKQLSKKTFWQSILSVAVLGIFILLATGSLEFLNNTTKDLGGGVFETTEYYSDDRREITTGKHDNQGRWHGPVKIEVRGDLFNNYTEEVNMVNGERHGKSKTSGYRIFPGEFVYFTCYNMGKVVDCEKSTNKSTANVSSYQVLSNKYPWFLYTLNAFGFEDKYVNAYMDTLEKVLGTNEFEDKDFDDHYGNVISDLEKTAYDSIITFNSIYSIYNGLEEIKNSELRLAVIDRYRSGSKSTYNMVKSTYPNYLLSLNEKGVNDQDFEGFCFSFDSCMVSYGTLDLKEPFFIDSVDARMFRAMDFIISTGDSSSKAMLSLKSAVLSNKNKDFRSKWNTINPLLKKALLNSGSQDVAQVVLSFIKLDFDKGDKIKQAVKEAYLNNKGVIFYPTVTTEFSNTNSATSATLKGYVIEDGGAAVTSRGIVWATFYNPTINENSKSSGTGTGIYTVNLTGLTEGVTYYARAYAINSKGTSYGNCISFIASISSGINENKIFATDFTIYPNPNSALSILSLNVESSESMVLTIINLKGQKVFYIDLGSLPQGENLVELDLSGLQDGMYTCQLTNKGEIKLTRKLVIAH